MKPKTVHGAELCYSGSLQQSTFSSRVAFPYLVLLQIYKMDYGVGEFFITGASVTFT